MVGRAPWIAACLAFLAMCMAWSAPAPVRAESLTERFDLRGQVQDLWITVQDRGLFGRRDEQPVVGRFSTQGGPGFTLDQSGARPLLRFEGQGEIWALRPSAGVRGDIYYRNDVGEVVLRATRIGGLTLYTAANPGGLPCAVEGGARPLRMPSQEMRTLLSHLIRESGRASEGIDGNFFIRARGVEEEASDIVGDAATVAVDGILRLAQTESGRERLAGLREINITSGTSPGVRRDGARLIITVTERLGPAGRPSSARVARALQ